MFLIIGLGNPGDKYKYTRHNVGFWVIDRIAKHLNIQVEKKEARSLIQSTFWEGKKVILVKPQTYMNLSGQAVMELLNFYHDQIEDLLIIHDDLDLPPGQLRFKNGGGTGGHNGLKSIVQYLNSPDFDRLKIGIGRPGPHLDVKDHVLTTFSQEEKVEIEEVVEKSVEAVREWLAEGINSAMNKFNKRSQNQES